MVAQVPPQCQGLGVGMGLRRAYGKKLLSGAYAKIKLHGQPADSWEGWPGSVKSKAPFASNAYTILRHLEVQTFLDCLLLPCRHTSAQYGREP